MFLNKSFSLNLFFIQVNTSFCFPASNFFIESLQQLSLILFLLGLLTLNLNEKNLIIALMGIELILLACNLNFVLSGLNNDSYSSFVYTLFILTISAVETALGVGILIICYTVNKSVRFTDLVFLKE